MDKKIFYITKDKLKELKEEYQKLSDLESKNTVGHETPKVLESEDLNPEFVSFQEDVDFIRSRMDEVKDILDHHEIIKKPSRDKQGFVGLGAKVMVDVNGKKDEFTIVSTLEANPALGKISDESPVGRALLGRKAGEEITVESPAKITYKVKNIKYEIS